MVIRSTVCALAVVAALGAVALALPEKGGIKGAVKADGPFGGLPKSSAPSDSSADSASADRSKLIELASLTNHGDKTAASIVKTADTSEGAQAPAFEPVTPTPVQPQPAVVQQAKAPDALAFASTADQQPPALQQIAAIAPTPAAAPDPAIPVPVPPPTKTRPAAVNINTASSATLDHLPGGGRVGHAIVTHRPYRTVADLVHKRVLRMSDFQRIQASLTVD